MKYEKTKYKTEFLLIWSCDTFFSFQSRDYVNEPLLFEKKKWIQYFDTLKNDQNSFPILFQKKVSFLNEVLKKVRNYYFISI